MLYILSLNISYLIKFNTSLESLDTAPLKPGTYRTTRVLDGSEQ